MWALHYSDKLSKIMNGNVIIAQWWLKLGNFNYVVECWCFVFTFIIFIWWRGRGGGLDVASTLLGDDHRRWHTWRHMWIFRDTCGNMGMFGGWSNISTHSVTLNTLWDLWYTPLHLLLSEPHTPIFIRILLETFVHILSVAQKYSTASPPPFF